MVIYVDILLFVNTVVNYAVLMTSEKLLKRDCRLYRIISGAFVGALFSLLIFIRTESRFYILLLRAVSCAVITLVTFGIKTRSEFIKAILCNTAVTTVYCGMFILFYQLFKPPDMIIVNDIVYLQVDPLWLTALTVVIYIILLALNKLFSERIKSTVVPLRFTVDSQSYSCVGKIDTGCNLTEPFSSSPVIIADSSVFTIQVDTPSRIIPYTALSGSSFLRAVKAESVSIDKKPVDRDIYIASAELKNRHYQAIINSDITR